MLLTFHASLIFQCSVCNDDEIEVSPCTLTSDRKCEPKGALKPDQEYFVAWAEMQACDMDSSIEDLDAYRAYLSVRRTTAIAGMLHCRENKYFP